jgi:hypothetical protein
MRRFKESQKKVEEASPVAERVYETEMEMLWGFHFGSRAPSPSFPNSEKLGISEGFIPEGGNSSYQPPPPPPPFTGPPAPKNHEPRRHIYGDFLRQALRRLGEESLSNRDMAIFIANQDLELQKVRSAQRAGAEQFQTPVKRPTRKLPRRFDGELESDFTTWNKKSNYTSNIIGRS